MNKYLYVAKNTFSDQAVYPIRFITRMLINLALLSVYLILWNAVYKNNETIANFTLAEITLYYTATLLIKSITISGLAGKEMADNIATGTFSNLLIKPVNFNVYYFTRINTMKALELTFPLIILFFITLFFNNAFISKPLYLIFLVVSLLFATTINYFIYTIIGIFAAVITTVGGIRSIFGRVADILSGAIFPLTFFPAFITGINNYLPFKYMHYLPLNIYLVKISINETILQIGIQIIWIVLLYLLYTEIYKICIKKYESIGI